MLALRPNCESCDKHLPPDATDAYICSYECTFCADCINRLLMNVCPNCGGGFTLRPIRPTKERRVGISLSHQPASTSRVNTKYTIAEITEFAQSVKDIAPEDR